MGIIDKDKEGKRALTYWQTQGYKNRCRTVLVQEIRNENIIISVDRVPELFRIKVGDEHLEDVMVA